MSSIDFKAHALRMLQQNILTIPLTLDSQGFPKKPITPGWTQVTKEQVPHLPWRQARGIGIVLGEKSNNLCALDIDDEGLADTLLGILKGPRPPRVIRTARRRCHVYVRTSEGVASRVSTVIWDGRSIKIEQKANGTQVAAPPTPGYKIEIDGQPLLATTLAEAWATIRAGIMAQFPGRLQEITPEGSANYPSPWRQRVPVEGTLCRHGEG